MSVFVRTNRHARTGLWSRRVQTGYKNMRLKWVPPLSPQRVQNQPLSATVLIQRVQNGWKLSKRTYSKVGNQLFISWNSFHWADFMTYRHLKLGCLRWSWRTIMAIWKSVARRTTHISSELAQHLYNSILTQRLQWVAFFPILHNFGDGNVYGLEPSQHE